MSIWKEAQQTLDFDLISNNIFKKIENAYVGEVKLGDNGFRFLSMYIPGFEIFGELKIIEWYHGYKDRCFLIWEGDILRTMFRNRGSYTIKCDNFFYKIDTATGNVLNKGKAFNLISSQLTSDNLSKLCVSEEDKEKVTKEFLEKLEILLNIVVFEIKQSIRCNAEDFILSLCHV